MEAAKVRPSHQRKQLEPINKEKQQEIPAKEFITGNCRKIDSN